MIPPLSEGQARSKVRLSLLARLRAIRTQQDSGERDDREEDHREADELLLACIDDTEIATAFRAIRKWYA